MTHEYTIHDAAVERPERDKEAPDTSVEVLVPFNDIKNIWMPVFYRFSSQTWHDRHHPMIRIDVSIWTEMLPPPPKSKVWVKKEVTPTKVEINADGRIYVNAYHPAPIRNVRLVFEQEEDQP